MASISMAPVAGIGAEIKRLREAAGLTQGELARAMGVGTAAQVSQWAISAHGWRHWGTFR